MSDTPEYVKDYLRIITEQLMNKHGLTKDQAEVAVRKSAIFGMVTSANEEICRIQIHRSIDSAVDDIYSHFEKGMGGSLVPNIDEMVWKRDNKEESLRLRHKEDLMELSDIPLEEADDED